VVVSRSSLTDPGTTYCVCGVDPCVNRQAACGDEAAGGELINRRIDKFLCLARVRADLGRADWSGANWFRH